MKWKHSHRTPNRAGPSLTDRACSLDDVCFYSPADDRFCCAIGLTSCGSKCVFFFTVSADTLDCEILISAVHLRPALWKQIDKNYQNRDLKLKLWEEVAAECDSSCKQKCYFFIYWLQFSHVMCWGNNTKVIYHSSSFIRHSTWPSHIISSLLHIRLHCYNQLLFSGSRPTSYWNIQWMHLLPFLPSNLICY